MNLLLTMPGGSEWILIFLIFIPILLLPAIFFLLTLQKTLETISPENRKMPPSNVWLMFIPLFNIVWQFIIVDKISQSLAAECARLNIPTKDPKPTYNIGLAWNICNTLSFIPFVGLAALVTFILYWVKVSEFKTLMKGNQHNYMLDAERNIFHGDKSI
ncbi:MAG: hypothetical protein ABI267_05700 [Ginsengibacter sp.]